MKSEDFREFYAAWTAGRARRGRAGDRQPARAAGARGLLARRRRRRAPSTWAGRSARARRVVEQFDSAAAKLVTALRAAGGEPDHLVSLVVYATDVDEYRASLSRAGRGLAPPLRPRYPAMALVGVAALFEPDAQGRADGRRRRFPMTEQLLDRARRLGHDVFAPLAEQGTPGRVNRPLVKALGDEGLLELALARLGERALRAPRGPRARLHRGRDGARAPGPRRPPDPALAAPRRVDAAARRRARRSPRSRSASPDAGSDAAALVAAGRAGRRRLPPDRHEDVDLERARRRRLRGVRADRRGRPAAA